MLSSSARRILPNGPASPVRLNFANFTVVAAARPAASTRHHSQRRYTSSKPPSPANGGKGMADNQPAPAQPARSNGRKAKENVDDCSGKGQDHGPSLPSVPSTEYLKSQDITASYFFSFHRPISVTEVWPRAISNERFSSIFTESRRQAQSTAVIGTIWNTIQRFDQASSPADVPLDLGLRSGLPPEHGTDHDNPAFPLPFPPHILTPTFTPFTPPPPPMPLTRAQALAAGREAAAELAAPAGRRSARTYHALLTVEESRDELGDVRYTGYASDLVPAPAAPVASSFLERMRARQRRHAEERRVWWRAISVKRQRKLRMKKHKYKKMLRKTRNERRRQDRT